MLKYIMAYGITIFVGIDRIFRLGYMDSFTPIGKVFFFILLVYVLLEIIVDWWKDEKAGQI